MSCHIKKMEKLALYYSANGRARGRCHHGNEGSALTSVSTQQSAERKKEEAGRKFKKVKKTNKLRGSHHW
jgi:hypothetical protein